jgi:hypothetical protein
VAVVSRAFWFAAGIASGVYGVFKVKRTVEIFTPDGVGARIAAVRRGARVFADEVTVAAREREAELLAELRATTADDRLLSAAQPAAIAAPRHRAVSGAVADHAGRRPASLNANPDIVDTRESVTDGHR